MENKSQMSSEMKNNIRNLTDGAKEAIVLMAPAFRFGGNWGYIEEGNPHLDSTMSSLVRERPNIQAYKVGNGAVVFAKPAYLVQVVNSVVPNVLRSDFQQYASDLRDKDLAEFEKTFDRALKGEGRFVKKAPEYLEFTVGVFSVNDTNIVSPKGVDFPAYKLTMTDVLIKMMEKAQAAGRTLFAYGATDDKSGFDRAEKMFSSRQGQVAIYRGMEISPTKTAVFLTVRIK